MARNGKCIMQRYKKEVVKMEHKELLIDNKTLLRKYPAFSRWGLEWLIRNRRIPIVNIGRRIYFDLADVEIRIRIKKIKKIGDYNEKQIHKI